MLELCVQVLLILILCVLTISQPIQYRVSPSSEPSASPTGALYYPDWVHDSQVCINDGATPKYMNQLMRDNYLYRSKEECCATRKFCHLDPGYKTHYS